MLFQVVSWANWYCKPRLIREVKKGEAEEELTYPMQLSRARADWDEVDLAKKAKEMVRIECFAFQWDEYKSETHVFRAMGSEV